MRKQEILALRWKDINFKERKYHIQKTVVESETVTKLLKKVKHKLHLVRSFFHKRH
jgi:integrase